jgi:2-hydroxy-3-keto-5-methylthiopentenyl-1-phosphate phosphatase
MILTDAAPSRREGSKHPPPFQVFLDFDGTLVGPNVAIVLVEAFAPDGARVAHEVDLLLHSGELTLRQAWERQAALLRASQIPEMARYAVENVPLRPGAHRLLEMLDRHGIPVTIVSGGIDFYIYPILEREKIRYPVLADSMETNQDGQIHVLHPHGHPTCRLCGICKALVVSGATGPRTVFIGDGSTDRYAAEVSDIVFARRRLLEYCRAEGIPCYPFETFDPVTEQVAAWLERGEPLPPPRQRGRSDTACPISRDLAASPSAAPA